MGTLLNVQRALIGTHSATLLDTQCLQWLSLQGRWKHCYDFALTIRNVTTIEHVKMEHAKMIYFMFTT
jgi:hypothetical protein